MDQLQPLMFLEGEWHGKGQGPYGPYEFEAHVTVRGRWLLMTSNYFEPNTNKVTYVSTQVYGYDDTGLVLQLFDTAGAFEFHGVPGVNRVQLDWKDGKDWRRSEYWLEDGGNVGFRYQAMVAADSAELSKFEGTWVRGRRAAIKG